MTLDFCNAYFKQSPENKIVEFKGKPIISAKILDKKTMDSQNFQIGRMDSGKMVTIYNKSLDIVKKGKDYIQKFWIANGITQQVIPISDLHPKYKDDKEKIHLEGYKNIYRFELRLKGKKIKEIQDFDIELLKTPDGLMSIMKFATRQYFDAYWKDNERSTRCTPITLLPFDRFNIQPLQKIVLKERGDIFKTKLALHKNVRQLYNQALNPEESFVYEMMIFDIQAYNLQKWFEDKYQIEWKKIYGALQRDKEYNKQVEKFISEIIKQSQETLNPVE